MLTEKLKWYHSPKEFKQPANDWTSHTQTDIGESTLTEEAVEEGVPHGDRQLTSTVSVVNAYCHHTALTAMM